MQTRRDFLKKAALLAAGGSSSAVIRRAAAIDPAPGTTWRDAEHVVILMQENRSFDHCYGALRGVRGFGDPRAVSLPDGNPVWLQTNAAGATHAPFHMSIHSTKATWMGSLPHSWPDQCEARNGGKHDRWLDAKASGAKELAHLPFTMGYYRREDLPFYYELADAFTVCDQNFCSSLTGTTPNRLYLWTGTIRDADGRMCVRNSDVEYSSEVSWTTFPERLEDAGLSWRVYQNEISLSSGLTDDEDSWLANFTDNPLEWFTQFRVRFAKNHRPWLEKRERELVASLEGRAGPREKERAGRELARVRETLDLHTPEEYAALPERDRSLHARAFSTNVDDPDYRQITTLRYGAETGGGEAKEMTVPKGDLFHRFRRDVAEDKLPAVSWMVAPRNFSDHPDAPWYGAWYLAEAMEILTSRPEVWRKTIFILCYDENDGWFDHVPPFTPPRADRSDTGRVSAGIDTALEHVTAEQEAAYKKAHPKASVRGGPAGLGFRVPLVIASPWSRGGRVCSEVFDHTSIVQFLEEFASAKAGKPVRETNITEWRRTVCGDLLSAFRPWNGADPGSMRAPERTEFLRGIHEARLKPEPGGHEPVTPEAAAAARTNGPASVCGKAQEPGIRPSCALPYELGVDGTMAPDGKTFTIRFSAGRAVFGDRSAGSPFHVYSPARVKSVEDRDRVESGRVWSYAVRAGDTVEDTWKLSDFADGLLHLRVHGPNGFFREFRRLAGEVAPEISLHRSDSGGAPSRDVLLLLKNPLPDRSMEITLSDGSYGAAPVKVTVGAGEEKRVPWSSAAGQGWHHVVVTESSSPQFLTVFAGRIETGADGVSDPAMSPA